MPARMQVLKTGGNMHLGGEDFDQKIMDWFLTVRIPSFRLITTPSLALMRSSKSAGAHAQHSPSPGVTLSIAVNDVVCCNGSTCRSNCL